MADEPFRLRVKKALTAAIKTVTPANGYVADLADFTKTSGKAQRRVFRGRLQFGDNDPIPMVSILEHPRALDALLAPDHDSQRVGEWDLLIQGFADDDFEDPTDNADMLVADVIKCLAKEGKRKGGSNGREPNILGLGSTMPCVTKLAIGSPVVRPADGVNSDKAFFWFTLTLTLAEDVEQPFA